MNKILVAGCGTNVGKTVVSAILATALEADYWKPVQCGPAESADTVQMQRWLDKTKHTVFEPAYSLQAPVSPDHAARLEKCTLNVKTIVPPETPCPLIIESVGGVCVPLTTTTLAIDLFEQWKCLWIIVSKHYLGSINHTLLTVEALQRRRLEIAGIVFNGNPNPDAEKTILAISGLPFFGRLLPEKHIGKKTIQRYSKQWQASIRTLL